MTYTLYGSQTSLFVRRIRMLMEDIPFELKELNIFDTEDSLVLNKVNPINQVPALVKGDLKIWDSRQIFNYIRETYSLPKFTWDQENALTAIEGAMNSGVSLVLMKRSGMNIDEQYMYVNRQKERIESVLDYLKPMIEKSLIKEWNFLSMTLYCFLDWAIFRGILNIETRPECQKFLDTYSEKPIVTSTAIPKA